MTKASRPPKGPTRRQIELGIARKAGYENDTARFVRALVERQTASSRALHDAWGIGVAMRVREEQTGQKP